MAAARILPRIESATVDGPVNGQCRSWAVSGALHRRVFFYAVTTFTD